MKLCIAGYLPPPSFTGSKSFLDNLQQFKRLYPLHLISDHPYELKGGPAVLKLKASPEIYKNILDSGNNKNRWGLSNGLFFTSIKLMRKMGYTHVLYLESDCRVGCDYWDEQIVEEFLERGERSTIAAGSTVCYAPCNNSDPDFQARWATYTGRSARIRPGYPVPTYGKGSSKVKQRPAIIVNGAAGIYSINELEELFDLESPTRTLAAESTAWDWEIGLRAYQKYGAKVFDKFLLLNTVFSSYGDILTNEAERRQMLMSGRFVAVHQIKSTWKPGTSNCTLIQMGRFGDIINILPAARIMARQTGIVEIAVTKQFASILDGVRYVRPVVISPEKWTNTAEARKILEGMGKDSIITSQLYRTDEQCSRHAQSFSVDSWREIGLEKEYYKDHPLVFDNRDHNTELELIKATGVNRKTLLVSLDGHSSPVSNRDALLKVCRRSWEEVKLPPKCNHLYDMLGIMDTCHSAVLSDSAPLHMAAGTGMPYGAMITDKPSSWHGTLPRRAPVARMLYGEAHEGTMEVMLNRLRNHRVPIHHFFSWHKVGRKDVDRYAFARTTWSDSYFTGKMRPCPVFDWEMPRNGTDVGDAPLPYFKDIFDLAAENCSTIILFTNSDICFDKSIIDQITRSVSRDGCWYGQRIDCSDATVKPNLNSKPFCGADAFAFSPDWWRKNRDRAPDLLLAREGWDAVMKLLMQKSGFKPLLPVCWHQVHANVYDESKVAALPGQIHNRTLVSTWMKTQGRADLLICEPNANRPMIKPF